MSQRLEHFTACPGQFWGDLGGFKLCCWVWEGVTPPEETGRAGGRGGGGGSTDGLMV